MELKNGYPYWLIKNGLPHQYPRLNKNLRSDVVIIGGGISGALAAYHLTHKGIDCILLDKRTIGLGSTCASTSLIQYELDKPLHEMAESIGRKKASNVYTACAEAVESLWELSQNIGFQEIERTPSLYFSAAISHNAALKKEFKARKETGLQVTFLDEPTVRARYGFSAPCAIESELGLSADVYLLDHALCRHALKKGLSVYDRTNVIHVEERPRSVKVYTEQGFTVNAKYLVNASGYEAGNFIAKKLITLMSTYAFASEHLEEPSGIWKNRAMLWNTADPYLYMRLTSDNRIIVGGRDEALHASRSRDRLIKAKSRQLSSDFKKIFPHINLVPEFSWAGTFGISRDAMPFIGTTRKGSRIYYALGYGGNGILFSHMAGNIISDAITGNKNGNAGLFSFHRPT